jgi:hypothetical protein
VAGSGKGVMQRLGWRPVSAELEEVSKQKSFEAMFHAVKEYVEQMKLVYAERSEYSFACAYATWKSFSLRHLGTSVHPTMRCSSSRIE